jgi:hypothetical protein
MPKALSAFCRYRHSPDGLNTRCKACCAAAKKKGQATKRAIVARMREDNLANPAGSIFDANIRLVSDGPRIARALTAVFSQPLTYGDFLRQRAK